MAIKPISVTQFNSYVKRVLQSDPLLGNVSVIGEVSNLKYHGSGHVFFTLKDENSKLACFLPSDGVKRLRYELTEGMLITAAGYISVYDKGGTYSLNIRDISIEGTGSLAMALEALKIRLEKEGLFDAKYKKTIPLFPRQVAVITSETGAAVQDIIKIIKQRNDVVNVILYPCLVQGPDAAADIASAIERVNSLFPETDVIITGRGGGSAEELWAFNEEVVVRSIFLSDIPVISAVGHETDFTLTDYVSDKRAATPTEAAQLAVPDITVLRNTIKEEALDLYNKMEQLLDIFDLKTERYNMAGLKEQISGRIKVSEMKARAYVKDIIHTMENKLTERFNSVDMLLAGLQAASPYTIMEKGYGALIDGAGRPLLSLRTLKTGDLLTIIHKDGKIICSVKEVREASYDKGKPQF